MLKNYFKIAWRTLLKNRSLFFINVVGLAIGIATCLTIALFVVDELSYDRYNDNYDRVVRVLLKAKMGDEIIDEAFVPAPVAKTLEDEIPEVKESVRILNMGTPKITYDERIIRNGQFAFADPNIFEIFTLPLLKGDPKTALSRPNSLVLTPTQAHTLFGGADPMGKSIRVENIGFYSNNALVDNDGLYTVTGIMEEIPHSSHFHYTMLASMSSNRDAENQSWTSGNYYTYLLLGQGTNLNQLEDKFRPLVKKYMAKQLETALGMPFEEFLSTGNRVGLAAEPLKDVHFSNSKSNVSEEAGDRKSVYMFGAIALFMLLIACINFMNLSTAGASKRVREIGMRKVLGSNKRQLIYQFLLEAFISAMMAMCLGIILFYMALPKFNAISGKNFSVDLLLSPWVFCSLALLTILVGLLAGAYPAFFMSSFKPIQALKGRFSVGKSNMVRSGLVVFQFTVSISLILATIVVREQMDYIQNKDVGYLRKNRMVIRSAGRLGDKLESFKEELVHDPRIANITMSSYVPAGPTDQSMTIVYTKDPDHQGIRTRIYHIDASYIPTMGMEIISGRNFSKAFGSEKRNVIINQTAIKTFNLNEDPIGESLTMNADANGHTEELMIVGVVKDFNARSLRDPIEPLIMDYNPYYGLIIQTHTVDMEGLIKGIERKWEDLGTGEEFEYAFLDDLYTHTYSKEANMNLIIRIFAFLTIFVACLGLFGLVTFTAQQRVKEIGIRKVLGSSVSQIVNMLAKDFMKLVGISMVIAFPMGYYFMQKWLEDFAFRIKLSWWMFALAGSITLVIAFLTLSYKSIRAGRSNPVKSLRME